MKKSVIIFALIFGVCGGLAEAQNLNKSLVFNEGDRLFESNQYIKAMRFYKEVLDRESGHTGAMFQLGECHRLTFDYESALYYYKRVAELNDDRFPLATYHYADMLKHKGDFNFAVQEFDKFWELIRSLNLQEDETYRVYYKQAKMEKEGCLLALNDLTNSKSDHNFEICGDDINTPYMDFAAFTYDEGNYLCLTSSRSSGKGNLIDYRFGESFADIYRYKKSESGWKPYEGADKLERVINTKWGDGSGTFNRAGTKFYYTNCNEKLGDFCHVYVTQLAGGTWSEPQSLGESINVPGFDSRHPNVSPNGDTLFFASNRPGGYGKYDIWMSLNAGGENWSQPENLGDQINTPFFEVSPFYDVNERALFFSSDGHRGYGGFDIYMAKGLTFLDPEIFNPGYPFNSNKDEVFMFIAKDKGYLSSNRDGGFGKLDIYQFDIKTEQAIVTEISNEKAVAGRNSLFSDDYDFDSDKEEEIKEIISQFLAAKVVDVNLILTDDLTDVYQQLSLDDKEKINRIIYARIRKLNERDLQALRLEDEFYYQDLTSADKNHMDNLVTRFIEERDLALSVSLGSEESNYYKSLTTEDREKTDHLIATRVKQSDTFTYVPTTYLALAQKDKKQVDVIAYKYFTDKNDLDKLAMSPTQSYYLRELKPMAKEKVLASVKEKVLDMANDPKYNLLEEDRVFYQNLSTEHLEALRAIASSFIMENLNSLAANIDPKNLSVYKFYNPAQHATLDRILAKMINNTLKADTYYAEANLNSDQKVSAKSVDPANIDSYLRPSGFINEEEDKQRVKRFLKVIAPKWNPEKEVFSSPEVNAEIQKRQLAEESVSQGNGKTLTGGSDGSGGSGSLTQLASQDQQTTAPTKAEEESSKPNSEVTAQNSQRINPLVEKEQLNEDLSNEDMSFYGSLEPIAQKRVDRIIAMEYLNKSYKDPVQVTADDDYLKGLSTTEKTYLNLLGKNLKEGETLDIAQQSNLKEAFSFYSNQSPDLKGKWSRLVAREVLLREGKRYKISPEDARFKLGLSESELASLRRLQTFRFNNKRILSEELAVESNDTPNNKINFDGAKFNNHGYKYISVRGSLVDNESGKPLGSLPILVVDESGKVIAKTTTSPSGKFDFEDLPEGDYKVVTSETVRREGLEAAFFVKDLKVEGSSEGRFSKSVNTSIYFDFDSYQLRPEAMVTLSEIAEFYSRNNCYVELKSHTDNVGADDYNLNLSELRNDRALDYLKSLGVKGEDLEWLAIGNKSPIAPNNTKFGRQFNRRIDISLKSNEPISYDPMSVYLVRPKGTLFSISKDFNVDMAEIQRLNGLKSTDLKAYEPLRLPNPKGVQPNLDMLVELNASVAISNNIYVVKKGDTVITLAKRYNVPEELIIEMNDLDGYTLRPGQQLKMYVRGN